ncbi:MAG: DUF3168 domain-containing protein [Sphingomonadaceae bacterium]
MQASLELQQALVAALDGNAALAARGLKALDGPPPDSRAPYLSIGPEMVRARGFRGGRTSEHRLSVTYWDARGAMGAAKAVLAEVERAVLAMPRTLPTARILSLESAGAAVRRGPRDWTQAVLDVRALVVMETQDGD